MRLRLLEAAERLHVWPRSGMLTPGPWKWADLGGDLWHWAHRNHRRIGKWWSISAVAADIAESLAYEGEPSEPPRARLDGKDIFFVIPTLTLLPGNRGKR